MSAARVLVFINKKSPLPPSFSYMLPVLISWDVAIVFVVADGGIVVIVVVVEEDTVRGGI